MQINRHGRVAGKVAVISGGGSVAEGIGNGRASAILLGANGARIAVLDSSERAAQETARLIEAEGGEAIVITADVTSSADCESALKQVVKKWGVVDILVNNVGIMGPGGTAVDVDPDAWDDAMRINLKSIMLMSKYAIPHMVQGASIINIGSYAGLFGGHPGLFYPTSKGAIPNMTRTMAGHHGADGIRVNCVCPGSVFTPLVDQAGLTATQRDLRRRRTLLQIEGTGWDVGYAVLFLASDESRWVTGTTMLVDGGKGAGLPAFDAVPKSAKGGST